MESSTAAVSAVPIRQRVMRFYEHYNPSCVGSVDAILHTYRGREDDLMLVLVNKYGQEPPPDDKCADANLSPADVKKNLTSTAASRLELLAMSPPSASLQYRSESAASQGINAANERSLDVDAVRKRLETVISHGIPTSAAAPPQRSTTFDSHEANNSQHRQTIKEPKAPPLSAPTGEPRSANAQVAAAIHAVELKSRLYRFYKFYNPSVLPFIDELVVAAGDDAEGMMRGLVAQYGPEPVTAQAAGGVTRLGALPLPTASRPPGDGRNSVGYFSVAPERPPPRTNHLQFLKSPSPPRERLMGGLLDEALDPKKSLAARLQAPNAATPANVVESSSVTKLLHDKQELEECVSKLTDELDVKSKEVLDLRERLSRTATELTSANDDKGTLARTVSELRGEVSARTQEAIGAKIRITELETALHGATLQLEASSPSKSKANSEELELLEKMKSTVAVREHQNRLLRTQLTQVSTAAEQREEQITALVDERDRLASQVESLMGQLGVRKLSLVQSSDESRFYSIVEEIQNQFKDFYEERQRTKDRELTQYYAETKEMIAARDEVISQLSQTLTDEFRKVSPGRNKVLSPSLITAADRSGSTTEAEYNMAEELARAQLQLRVHQEEHRITQATPIGTISLRAPPAVLRRELDEVRELREKLVLHEAEAKAAKAALSSELGRQVDDLKDLHMRMREFDEERQQMERMLEQQRQECNYWREQSILLASNLHREDGDVESADPVPRLASGTAVTVDGDEERRAREEGAGVSGRPFDAGKISRTTMWSLLYER
jgi:hypothetical protein